MPEPPAIQPPKTLRETFALLFSWRTGPSLWAIAFGAGFYFLLLMETLIDRFVYPLEATLTWWANSVTILSAVGIIVHAATMLRVVQWNDEFMRSLILKRTSVAGVATVLLVTAWSLFAHRGWVVAFDPLYIYAVFALFHLLLIPFMNADRP